MRRRQVAKESVWTSIKADLHHKWKLLTDSDYRKECNAFDWLLFFL